MPHSRCDSILSPIDSFSRDPAAHILFSPPQEALRDAEVASVSAAAAATSATAGDLQFAHSRLAELQAQLESSEARLVFRRICPLGDAIFAR